MMSTTTKKIKLVKELIALNSANGMSTLVHKIAVLRNIEIVLNSNPTESVRVLAKLLKLAIEEEYNSKKAPYDRIPTPKANVELNQLVEEYEKPVEVEVEVKVEPVEVKVEPVEVKIEPVEVKVEPVEVKVEPVEVKVEVKVEPVETIKIENTNDVCSDNASRPSKIQKENRYRTAKNRKTIKKTKKVLIYTLDVETSKALLLHPKYVKRSVWASKESIEELRQEIKIRIVRGYVYSERNRTGRPPKNQTR
jgi:hypothetical protein